MKRNIFKQIVFGIAVLILLASCGGGGGGGSSSGGAGTSRVTVTIGEDVRVARITTNKSMFLAKLQRFFRKMMPDSAIATMPSNVYKIKITISAPDITTPVGGTFNVTPGGPDLEASFDVPNGNNRRFIVEEENNTGHLVYRGETTINLTGSTVDVPVTSKNINTVVQEFLDRLKDTLNKGTALTAADLEPFYAQNFGVDNGWNRAQSIDDMFKDKPTEIKKITSINNVVLTARSDGAYTVDFDVSFDDGSFESIRGRDEMVVTHENGALVLKGNGYYSDVEIEAEAHVWVNNKYSGIPGDGFNSAPWSLPAAAYTSGTKLTGLMLYAKDRGNKGIESVVITGPGLPGSILVGGVLTQGSTTLSRVAGTSYFKLPASHDSDIPTNNYELFVMTANSSLNSATTTDTIINNIPDNAVYTVEVYTAPTSERPSGLLETRTVKLPKRPYTNAEIAAANFFTDLTLINGHSPDVTSTGNDNRIAAANIGSTLSFSFKNPMYSLTLAPYTVKWIDVELNYWNDNNQSAWTDIDVALNPNASVLSGLITTEAPIGWSPSPQRGHLQFYVGDSYGRNIVYHWTFQP